METSAQRYKVILCIDDDPGVLGMLRRVLHGGPYQVITASSPWEGAKLAYTMRPDLILLDMMMPGLNGKDLLAGFRQTLGEVPVVLITGRESADDAVEAYELGAAHYIRKPFENQHLLEVVEFLIGDISDERREELMARL
jgi:DNA-binding response OmpR family regulator